MHKPNQEISFSHLICKSRKQHLRFPLRNWREQVQKQPPQRGSPFAAHLIPRHFLSHQQGPSGERDEKGADGQMPLLDKFSPQVCQWLQSCQVWLCIWVCVNPDKEKEAPVPGTEASDCQMRAEILCLWYRLGQLTSISYFKISLNLHFMCASFQL